jgi:phosphopantothenoylcysteine synthetase/decarboxylase
MKPTFLITSGPTREFIDPVRFITNASSGRMGRALAASALKKGFRVIFISGPTGLKPPAGVKSFAVDSAREMFSRVKASLGRSDIVIGAAAVADYRPQKQSREKIKKRGSTLSLRLVKNPDVIEYAGKNKGNRVVVGFALESENLLKNAKKKLLKKNLDIIVANRPNAIGGGKLSAVILFRNGKKISFNGITKKELSKRIVDESFKIWGARQAG